MQDDDPLRELRVAVLARIGGTEWAEKMADRPDIVEKCDQIVLKALFGKDDDDAA